MEVSSIVFPAYKRPLDFSDSVAESFFINTSQDTGAHAPWRSSPASLLFCLPLAGVCARVCE